MQYVATYTVHNVRIYFIYHTYTGYYDSSVPSSANNPSFHSGGQCELGVKMIIIIGEVFSLLPNGSLPTQNGNLPDTGGMQLPTQDQTYGILTGSMNTSLTDSEGTCA